MRDSLMLSDTAMVLLWQYAEAWEEWDIWRPIRLSTINGVLSRNHTSDEIRALQNDDLRFAGGVVTTLKRLIYEIWYLWHYPDIPIVRHLDWHLTLDSVLMQWVVDEFALSQTQIAPRTVNDIPDLSVGSKLGSALYNAYQAQKSLAEKDSL